MFKILIKLAKLSIKIRMWFTIKVLRYLGAKVSNRFFMEKSLFINISDAKYLTIEDEVVISAGVDLIMHDSSLSTTLGFPIRYGPIILRQNCYIGQGATILYNTEVGEHTIVGAGSLVKGKLEPYSVYVGIPARRICSVEELRTRWLDNKDSNLVFATDKPTWE